MAQLLMADQKAYVPSTMVNGKPEILTQIPLHGDQLFEERARNVQSTFQDGGTRLACKGQSLFCEFISKNVTW